MSSSRLSSQRLFAHRLACQRAMAMPPDTTAVIVGSAHCEAKWGGCANTSPRNVAIALIVACRAALSIVRSICARRATATAALTIPQTEARNACSKLNAARTLPRATTRKQASHAPPNFSAAGRANRPLMLLAFSAVSKCIRVEVSPSCCGKCDAGVPFRGLSGCAHLFGVKGPQQKRHFAPISLVWWRGDDEREGHRDTLKIRKREARRSLPREVVADERVAAGGIIS